MQFPRINIVKIMCALVAMVLVNCAAISTANAQEKPPTPVGWEVRSTNTPGGGGELKSQGVTGKETPFFIVKNGPSVAGSAVVNIVIVYYASAEDLALAKKLEADAKKKKEDEKKKKEDDQKKKKGAGGKDGGKGDGKKPPQGPDVPTFDPRTHKLDEDGKVVPIDPKQKSPSLDDHKNCDKPDKFECGEHYQWWLENHKHRNTPKSSEPNKSDQNKTIDPETKPMDFKGQPRIIMTGSVVAGEDTTIRVVDPKGAFISGVVVALPNGETATTDSEGKATVRAPKNTDTMVLTLVGFGVMASSWVRPSGGAPSIQAPPSIDPPSFLQPGQEASIGWTGAGPDAGILIDGKPVQILASSPTGCVIQVPSEVTPGTHTMSYQTGGSTHDVVPIDTISLSVEPPKTMIVGQKAVYTVRILGTDRKLNLNLQNLSSTVAKLIGQAAKGTVTSSGGKDNVARVEVQTMSPGQLMFEIVVVKQTDSASPTILR